jgi:hypothetical protein
VPVHPLPSRRAALLLALTLPLGLSGCGSGSDAPDVAKLDRLLLSYVDALNRKDTARLSTLLGSNHDGNDIASRLTRFGGRGLKDVRITHQRATADTYVVFLSARAGRAGRPFEAREIAAWRKQQWTLTPWPAPIPSEG